MSKKIIWGDILPKGSIRFEELYSDGLKNIGPNTGDLVSFVGIVRASSIYENKKVVALEVEGWEEGREIMQGIAKQTFENYHLTLTYIVHLIGRINVGEPIVYVLLGSEHREAAFKALDFIVHLYKKEAPVWKKEIYEDGSGKWIYTHKEE